MAAGRSEEEQAYALLATWCPQPYDDPCRFCPYDAAAGASVWLWGGPLDAGEVLTATWGALFTEDFLKRVAERIGTEASWNAWSGTAGFEERMPWLEAYKEDQVCQSRNRRRRL